MKEKTILNKLRVALGINPEINLETVLTIDGLEVFAEAFETGEAVYALDGEERMALEPGEYELNDGRILVIKEKGVIDSLKEKAAEQETEISEEDISELAQAATALKAENEKLKAELNKPAALPIRKSPAIIPTAQLVDVDLRKLTPAERVNERLFGLSRHAIPMKFRNNSVYRPTGKLNLTTSITGAYAGEFTGMYISAALLSGDTLANDAITIKPNVAYKTTVKKAVITGIITDASCDFTDAGDVTLTDRVLTPKALQVNKVLCKADFVPDWESIEMGYSAFKNMPPTFQGFIIQYMAAAIGASVETSIWQGTEATDGEFGGFTTLLAADSTVIDVTNDTVTAANVISEMAQVVAACPVAVRQKPDTTLYVSSNIYYAYVDALGGFGANGLGANGVGGQGTLWYTGQQLTFGGVKVFHAPGLPDNEMVLAQKSNLWFGTGLMSDHNMVKLIDTADILGDDNFRYICRFTGSVQYGIGSDIVYYWANA